MHIIPLILACSLSQSAARFLLSITADNGISFLRMLLVEVRLLLLKNSPISSPFHPCCFYVRPRS